MTLNESYYRKMMGALGKTMLLFILLMNIFGVLISFFVALQSSSVAGGVIYQLLYGTGYFLVFVLSIPFFRAMTKKIGHAYCPAHSQPMLSRYLPLILLAGIALIFSAASVNSAFVNVFNYSEFSSEVLWEDVSKMDPYEIVLQFLTVCLIPGVCEELLFRGAILTNCLPFGRGKAILISSLLFSLMHQNVEQILYAFVAGVILGIVYERTQSIWTCILLHVLNNFTSLFSSVLHAKLGETLGGYLGMLLFEAIIFFLGAISLVILIARFFSQKDDFKDGVFGKEHLASDHYAAVPVGSKRSVTLFFTPTMISFLVICFLQIALLILMAVLYGTTGIV